MAPTFKPHLNLARGSISGFECTSKRHTSPPLSAQSVYAFAHRLLTTGRIFSAYLLMLSFAGYVPATGALRLTWRDVKITCDFIRDGYPPHTSGLSVPDSKTATDVGE